MPGKVVKCADLVNTVAPAPVRSTDWTAVTAIPVDKRFKGSETVDSFPSSDAGGNIPSELEGANLGLVGGLIGVGLAIADVGLVT